MSVNRAQAPVVIIQHVEPEGPGAILEALQARNLDARIIGPGEEVPAPADLRDLSGLVVMGGPMGVRDLEWDPRLQHVDRLVRTTLDAGRPVLGVCLGSQLLAAALGAIVRSGARKEIGWHPVTLADAAQADHLFRGIDRTFNAFHWHGDVFDLPSGAVALASSLASACQAFRWGTHTYGLLFHLEVDAAAIGGMATAFGDELAAAGLTPDEIIAAGTHERLNALRRLARTVFDRWAALLDAPAGG